MLTEFVTIIRSFINKAIYVWGGQGEVATESKIRAMETSPKNIERALTLYRKRVAQGINPVIMFDCSGLVIYTLMKLGLIDYDTTADGIYDKCKKISKGSLSLGDFCFRINSEGNATHIGIVTKIMNGVVYVTESIGRDDGVVERPIDATVGYWEKYGKNPFVKEDPIKSIVNYESHVQYMGWIKSVSDGTTSGTIGKRLRMEAIKIFLSNVEGGIDYRTHVQNIGWTDWKHDGQVSGTVGKSLRLEAIEIKLTGAIANSHKVQYRVHVQNIGWMDWVENGMTAGTTGRSLRMEAIEIKIVPK